MIGRPDRRALRPRGRGGQRRRHRRRTFGQTAADYYRAIFESRVLGILLSLKHQLPVMIKRGGGSVINLSSIGGQVGRAGASVRVASKLAAESLTKSAAFDVASRGVRVNAVAADPVETDMLNRFTTDGSAHAKSDLPGLMPVRRGARLDEIAQTIVFLASDKTRFLSGQSFAVDGGYAVQ